MKQHFFFLSFLMILFVSCQGEVRQQTVNYPKGNLYGSYGQKMTTSKLIDILTEIDITGITKMVFQTRWLAAEEDYRFKQFEGENAQGGYQSLYTGVLRDNGPLYTWGYQKVKINSLKELTVNVGWKKPVYVSVEKKTLPLTAVFQNESLKSGIGVKSDDFIYVGTDTIEDADIWYCGGMANQIRNEAFLLGAAVAVTGECSYVQAANNALLLKDIARLTKAIEVTEEDLNNDQYDEMLKQMTRDKVKLLNDSLRKKLKIQKDLTDALAGANTALVKKVVDLNLQIANDALQLTTATLNFDAATIANYFIRLYGTSEEAQRAGRIANDNFNVNFQRGQKRIEEANKILAKQKAVMEVISKNM